MPGRVARSAPRSAVSRKTAARTSSPPAGVPDEGPLTSLRRAICAVFADAQKSTAGHRKAVIGLRKIQEACCYEPVNYKKARQSEDFEETDFNEEVTRCVLRVLAVRKAEAVGDRVVRFLGTYLNVASAKDAEIAMGQQADTDMDVEMPGVTQVVHETPTSRLTTTILSTLLPLLNARDKTIRFRSTQIISHIINSLDSLDDTLFHSLRLALLKRIHDKEAPVRLQAVYGLGRLAAEVEDGANQEDSDEEDDVGAGVLARLLNILQNDPAAEVRRNLLLNLPLTKDVLPYLLERARDADASTRRALYARLLPALGDFRHLSLTHREKLLRWGLRDRDENVRKATARLFRERWIEDCAALPADHASDQDENQPQKPANQAADPSLDALLELLERIDVVNSGGEGGIALVAMKEFWSGRPDYIDYVSFPDTFWEDLSPELAFVARTFNDYCRSAGKEDGYDGPRMLDGMIEDKLPEVTQFGVLLEREIRRLVQSVQLAPLGEDEEAEEECVGREFVVEQMLHMAKTFDYSDEVGRRKMFGLLREALANPELPEEATHLVIDVLRLVCGVDRRGEQEFCRVVVEAAGEVHDVIMDDEDETAASDESSVDASFHSATEVIDDDGAPQSRLVKKDGRELTEEELEEKAIREIVINMKCLHIALCMLQNVACELESNAHLVTLLNTLIVPAVRSREAPIRERGLCCLGLCCLLSLNLGEENLDLFLHCFSKGHPALQTVALQIIGDLLVTHSSLLTKLPATPVQGDTTLGATEMEAENRESPFLKPVLKAFTKALKSDTPLVQSTGAVALAKCMLANLITSPPHLQLLLLSFFDPDTASNSALRQSLSYFLPVYAHSRLENAERMVSVAVPVVSKLATLRETMLDEAEADSGAETGGGEGMVKLSLVGGMLVEWTDGRLLIGSAGANAGGAEGANDLHLSLAEHILDRLVTTQVGKEEKKVLFSMLGKLCLSPGSDVELLKRVLGLVQEAIESRVATEASAKKLLDKLREMLLAMMNSIMTAERGGGGEEETVLEASEVGDETAIAAAGVGDRTVDFTELSVDDRTVIPAVDATGIETEDEGEDESTVLQRTEVGFTTVSGTTIGLPEVEGTRVALGGDEEEGDTELLDSD
ncbi:hypothetical protein LTR62_005173 [Meristemomyces frigidus]|uniref:Nuclear condensin complex subunit 3 C-terminal domain-containing protein n=1 Tax=Meristemomyces frigidus TaxID=1508187 RepID=A0AAN7YFN3_9PEZI|nr:hypothetical protein LTR62_005173 [Meristemomyces frigidus]